MKISIIVPVFNSEKYLKRCLDSLINQTLTDIEIICINDGSTDSSQNILEEYSLKDSRIKIISQENAGLSSARNRAFDTAQGEFIGYVDSDDWVNLDYYEKLYVNAKKYNADIACGEIFKTDGSTEKKFFSIKTIQLCNKTLEKYKACGLPRKCYVWNKIYNREVLKCCNIYFEEGRAFEDILWSHIVLHRLNKLVTVPGACYYYYINPASITETFNNIQQEDLKYANKECMKYLISKGIKINYRFYTPEKRFTLKFIGIRFVDLKIWEHIVLFYFLGFKLCELKIKK